VLQILENVFAKHRVVCLGITPNLKEVWQSINHPNLEKNAIKILALKMDYIREKKVGG